jgi:formylglycine-generating enzyme required for sulfatase activity
MALTSPQSVGFTLHKAGSGDCTIAPVSVSVDAQGAFTAPLDVTACPGFFDGTDVTYSATVGGTVLMPAGNVTAVPYAKYADRAGLADCPRGYVRDATATTMLLCKRGVDEMVRVGDGQSAFWIDRYEASVWSDTAGTVTQYGASLDNYPTSFPDNGQRSAGFVPLYAVSKVSVTPSRFVTWFQALEACAASGKRLATGQEWLRAASGTTDPGASGGAGGACLTQAAAPRQTGGGAVGCVSYWGAQDMIGNLWELTGEWYAGVGTTNVVNTWTTPADGGEYKGDGTYNIVSSAMVANVNEPGLPAASVRGGAWGMGTEAGVFALSLTDAPSNSINNTVGFRCAVQQ